MFSSKLSVGECLCTMLACGHWIFSQLFSKLLAITFLIESESYTCFAPMQCANETAKRNLHESRPSSWSEMAASTQAQRGLRLYRLSFVSCVLAFVCPGSSSEVFCDPIDDRCPPGLFASGGNCVCPAEHALFVAIDRCEEQQCRAYLRNGYWAGYVEEPRSTEDDGTNGKGLELYMGKCPRGYCEGGKNDAPLLLPGLSNSSNLTEELNQLVCGTTRKGLLCGECSPGFGPGVNLFLAPCVHCATDPLSQAGWLLWLLLEALPLLLMLAAFLIFDINLLAGPLNSYLLYIQFVIASFPISSAGPIRLNNSAVSVIVRLAFIIFFGTFNFSFLLPPFCISPSAANLDQLDITIIKIFTRLLPFIIVLAIITLQWCNQYGYCGVPKCWHYLTHRFNAVSWLTRRLSGQSAVHGLSAFYILTYTRFLTYGATLYRSNVLEPTNPANASPIEVLALQGNHEFFRNPKHIVVAIAILVLIVFTILPPTFLLLVYPALPQLQVKLQHCKYKCLRRVSELKCFHFFSRPSIQHFGDLFQSSYKDNCRFFAGVLLLVWIMVVIAWNISTSREEGYVIMTALSLAVLALHSLLRPHRNHWINVVDSLMYTHLTASNILAVYIYSDTASMRSSQESWAILYLFVLFAPGAYPVFYLTKVLFKRWRRSCRKRPSTATSLEAADSDGVVYIEHVVEVDPLRDGKGEREMEILIWEN